MTSAGPELLGGGKSGRGATPVAAPGPRPPMGRVDQMAKAMHMYCADAGRRHSWAVHRQGAEQFLRQLGIPLKPKVVRKLKVVERIVDISNDLPFNPPPRTFTTAADRKLTAADERIRLCAGCDARTFRKFCNTCQTRMTA